MKCTEQGIELRVGYCMTYDEPEGIIYIGPCAYNVGNFSNTVNGRYIQLLVENASELNDHLCGPVNRKGRLCSECIEGFGLSITSLGLECSNCTGAWYGIPLYLFWEFAPITVFYVIILLLRVNVTSAPMVAFVIFSHVIIASMLSFGGQLLFEQPIAYYWIITVVTFYGFWNLDIFRYIFPPFCVSPELKQIHIFLITYISAFYPIFLISITWLVIKLHFYNLKPIVWLWSKLSKCSCIQEHNFDRNNSLIDVFATFFLLSYTKLVSTSGVILSPLNAMMYKNNTLSNTYQLALADARIDYFSKEHALYALISIFIALFIIAPSILLLLLYPIKVFQLFLFKCRLSTRTIASLNIFVEKYYSCYRDGTEGGKDMRSFASMYFILGLIAFLIFRITSLTTALTLAVVLYVSYEIVIALVRPYKKAYMNVIDTLIVANLALLSLIAEKHFSEDNNSLLTFLYLIIVSIFTLLPLLGLSGFIAYRILKWIKSKLDLLRTKKHIIKHRSSIAQDQQYDTNVNDQEQELPDRILHPQQYALEMNNFENVNYVRVS